MLLDGSKAYVHAVIDNFSRRILAWTVAGQLEWRVLKHQWLYLHSLDNLTTVRKLVAFYVTQHNQTMPHNTFQGQTPDEMYFGRGDQLPEELAARRQAARQQRVANNRSAACSVCPRAAALRGGEVAA